jgi:formylglycine-generating enzyme required for sulfatase activity
VKNAYAVPAVAALALGLLAVGWALAMGPLPDPTIGVPETSRIDPRAGSFGGTAVEDMPTGGIEEADAGRAAPTPFHMMRRQVSEAEYRLCALASGCPTLDRPDEGRPDFPVTGVNLRDAEAYARWLSRKNGLSWRLPSEAEWALAAGSRYRPERGGTKRSSQAFVEDWLADYEAEARIAAARDAAPRPFGSFGENEHRLADMAGNVWEWTSTCFERRSSDANRKDASEPVVNCGVHVAAGAHMSEQPFFIRDAKGGGCGGGAPPANFGIRLVRD